MPGPKILISAGEASGDLYAAHLVTAIRRRISETDFFGCTGPRMRDAGVRTVVDANSLSVVGIVEVLRHLPRIYGEFRKLLRAVEHERPGLAILTDSPSFHMRVARKLRGLGIPIVYLVAPQVWAWKRYRVRALRRDVDRLLCIFPFEQEFFREHRVRAEYIGHPLSRLVRPARSREEFFRKHRMPLDRPTVVLLPGSRAIEAARHLPTLVEASVILNRQRAVNFVLAAPDGAASGPAGGNFREPISGSPIQLIEGETWDAIAHADLALAASGTVTVEAALLGTPMVTFYRVARLTWWIGRILVKVPSYSMVNLVAGRRIVPELMQDEMTGEALAREARRLLEAPEARTRMRRELAEVRNKLLGDGDPLEKAAGVVQGLLGEGTSDVS